MSLSPFFTLHLTPTCSPYSPPCPPPSLHCSWCLLSIPLLAIFSSPISACITLHRFIFYISALTLSLQTFHFHFPLHLVSILQSIFHFFTPLDTGMGCQYLIWAKHTNTRSLRTHNINSLSFTGNLHLCKTLKKHVCKMLWQMPGHVPCRFKHRLSSYGWGCYKSGWGKTTSCLPVVVFLSLSLSLSYSTFLHPSLCFFSAAMCTLWRPVCTCLCVSVVGGGGGAMWELEACDNFAGCRRLFLLAAPKKGLTWNT